jgi:5-methylthioadenosine/S-adenosylhomocysteine deaminase
METVDTLINAGWVVPVEPDCSALADHSVAIRDGRIEAVLPTAETAGRYQAMEVIDRPGHVVLPGFVNAHTHAAMTLLRGLADDLPLMEWLEGHIWPAEAAWVGTEFVSDGVELAVAEMLSSGTTCFADMYFFPEVAARTAARAGIRAALGMIVVEFPSSYAEQAGEYLSKGLALRDEYKGHPLISTVFAPHAPYTVSDDSLLSIRRYADELEVPVQIHLHETAREVASSLEEHGCRPFERLKGLGLLTPLLMAVHMTQLEDGEIEAAAATGLSVVHCPESNLKLASGGCRTADLVAAGVNVALGTDGAASNNDLDMLGEMRTAALLGKHTAGDAGALDAAIVLRMATINGARALGIGEETGSLVAGKWADIACVDLDRVTTQPVYDPVSQLVYAAGREQVTDVWVAGRHRVVGGRVAGLDEVDLRRRAAAWQDRIAASDRQHTRGASA